MGSPRVLLTLFPVFTANFFYKKTLALETAKEGKKFAVETGNEARVLSSLSPTANELLRMYLQFYSHVEVQRPCFSGSQHMSHATLTADDKCHFLFAYGYI